MMDISTYAELDESESRFDGAIARRHMCQTLCFSEEKLENSSPKIVKHLTIGYAITLTRSLCILVDQ